MKSCFYAVKPHEVYNTRVMLPSSKQDGVPTTRKSCVVYELSCLCKARYVGHTTQRLANRKQRYIPISIWKKSNTTREQPLRMCKNNHSKMNCDSVIGNPNCAKTHTGDNLWFVGHARSSFYLSVLGSFYIKTQNPVLGKQKESIFSLGLFN